MRMETLQRASRCSEYTIHWIIFPQIHSFYFPLFDVSNILNPSQTIQGALVPTATSAQIWDYEVQSENLGNPQLVELHWRNNKEIIKDHFNKRVTQVRKVELVRVFVAYGFVIQEFGNKVLIIDHKLLAVVGYAQSIYT